MESLDPAGHLALPVGSRRDTQHRSARVSGRADVAVTGFAHPGRRPAQDLTGEWNLQNYVGHDCYIVAASAIVYNAVGRLEDDNALQRSFKQWVERPATLCIPLLLATFNLSYGSRTYTSDFFALRTDFWLSVYWLLLCGTLSYLLVFGSRALLVLRKDPRSRNIANLYLAASVSGIAACAVRMVTAVIPPFQGPVSAGLVWLLACMCGAGFALTSAQSWRQRMRWFQRPALHH